MADVIDTAAARFAARVQQVSTSIVDFVYEQGGQLSRDQLATIISRLDIENLVGDPLRNEVKLILSDYSKVLAAMEATAPVTETVLLALQSSDRATYLGVVRGIEDTIRAELTKGVLGGFSRSEMVSALRANSNLSQSNVQTIVDTTMRTFSRQVSAAMANNDPPNAKYVYIGPVDDKTRDVCLEMVAAGALTRKEIDARFPGAFVDGGGFNCRHRWALETDLSGKLNHQEKAEKVVEKENISGSKTLLEQQVEREENG